MSTPETPRAYAVDKKAMSPWIFKATHETPFAGEHLVKVYEAAPVDAERERLLDLMEGIVGSTTTGRARAIAQAEVLLREHGRLGKEES